MLHEIYAHPLYSFEHLHLITGLSPEEAACAIPIPQGFLITSPALRRRAATITTWRCLGAVSYCHELHRLARGQFERHAVPAGWTESLSYWVDRLEEAEDERERHALDLKSMTLTRHGHRTRCRDLWQSLALTARLALLPPLLPRTPPRGEAALISSLTEAARLAAQPAAAAALHRCGFGPAQQQTLKDLLAELTALAAAQADSQRARQAAAGAVLTIRGAIYGDLRRFAHIGQRIFLPQVARTLQPERLLLG